jgi:hypothetical protein
MPAPKPDVPSITDAPAELKFYLFSTRFLFERSVGTAERSAEFIPESVLKRSFYEI